MKETFRAHALQIAIISSVLVLFLSNAIGLLEIHLHAGPTISIRSLLFEQHSGQSGTFVPVAVRSTEFILLLSTGILLSVLLPLLNPVTASLLTLICIIPPVYNNYMNPGKQTLIPMEYSLLTILMLYAINVLISYFLETHSRQKIIHIFGQYIPPELVTEISRHPGQVRLDGESKRLTVFFCDLQNFSGAAEQLNPKQLTRLLNEYFTAMTRVLFEYGATIDKYIGDSIMAFWGAPLPQADHAHRAVLAAFAMQREIRRLSKQFVSRGWPGPSMGIGINTGMMNVGNMGSEYRIAYTVIGDSVNLASRLEGLTRTYKVPTIVSEETKKRCEGILFRELDQVRVKGKYKTTRIYQPVCLEETADEPMRKLLTLHEQAVNDYHNGQWEQAKSGFEQLKEHNINDGYYPIMLNRIDERLKSGN
ncbi:MAG: adenylate/guanylate cyclase domain-containing protein [Gammaproteobacteria bacterium]